MVPASATAQSQIDHALHPDPERVVVQDTLYLNPAATHTPSRQRFFLTLSGQMVWTGGTKLVDLRAHNGPANSRRPSNKRAYGHQIHPIVLIPQTERIDAALGLAIQHWRKNQTHHNCHRYSRGPCSVLLDLLAN